MARILIVDDAAFMRMMLKDILTKGGFEIAGEAADGNEAVAKYNELKPDLVTLDITMPNKDGIQALKEIKAALCALLWDSSLWLLTLSSQVPRISSLSHFRLTVLSSQSEKYLDNIYIQNKVCQYS